MANLITNYLYQAFLGTNSGTNSDLSHAGRVVTHSFADTGRERINKYRSNEESVRITFVPCTAEGIPTAVPDGNAGTNNAMQILGNIIDLGTSALGGVDSKFLWNALARRLLYRDGWVGMRPTVTLFANPQTFQATWSRAEPNATSSVDAAEKATSNEHAEDKHTNMTGVSSGNWKAPDGFIDLSGYCRNTPEVQIPILEYVFGLSDPWNFDVRMAQWAIEAVLGSSLANEMAGAPPRDAALKMWEMWVPTFTVSPGAAPLNKTMMRYFGCVTKFSYEQSAANATQIDFQWKLHFKVYQRRDYNVNAM
jgi:hypothetical protein